MLRLKLSSWLLLLGAGLIHIGFLLGWRWQQPLIPYFFDATVLSGSRGLDFYSIYQAGYNARHGRDVYESDPTKVEIVVPYSTPYRYLPVVAYTVGAALSLFAPLTAYKLWLVVIELTLFGCIGLTWHAVQSPDKSARLTALWLCFTPFYLELFMGQFSFVQGALVWGMLGLLCRAPSGSLAAVKWKGFDRLWIASVLWKINTIVFAPVLFILRRFRALILLALITLATTLPYFLIFPTHARNVWANNFGNSVTQHEMGNLGLRQLVFELLAAGGATPAVQDLAQASIVVLMLGLALLITWYSTRTETNGLSPLRQEIKWPRVASGAHAAQLLSLWLVAFFLISPQIWEHHYVMLLPVLVLAYWQKPNWIILLIWLALALPTPFGFTSLSTIIAGNHNLRAFPLEPVWPLLLQHTSKAMPALALFIYLGVHLRKAPATIALPA